MRARTHFLEQFTHTLRVGAQLRQLLGAFIGEE